MIVFPSSLKVAVKRWENGSIAEDGTNYRTDFDLIYRRVDT